MDGKEDIEEVTLCVTQRHSWAEMSQVFMEGRGWRPIWMAWKPHDRWVMFPEGCLGRSEGNNLPRGRSFGDSCSFVSSCSIHSVTESWHATAGLVMRNDDRDRRRLPSELWKAGDQSVVISVRQLSGVCGRALLLTRVVVDTWQA